MAAYDIDALPDVISLGRVGENGATEVEIDVTDWVTAYPAGTFSIYAVRPTEADGDSYAVSGAATSVSGGDTTLTWTVDDTDTAYAGRGKAEIRLAEGTVIKKSVMLATLVHPGIGASTTPASALTDWKDSVDALLGSGCGVGTTANRPGDNDVGHMYYDTTLNKPIWLKTQEEAQVDTLTVSHAATASANVAIALNGSSTNVALTSGDTVAQVDARIRATSFSGWTLSGTNGSGVIVFTKDASGAVSSASTYTVGSTGATASFAVTNAGVDAVWVYSDGSTVT
jgi:hypothetical protein